MMRDEWAGDGRSMVLVIGEEHQRRLVDGGHSKESIQDYLWPRLTVEDAAKYDKKLNLAAPGNILVVAAGGPGLAQSWLLLPHLAVPDLRGRQPAPLGRRPRRRSIRRLLLDVVPTTELAAVGAVDRGRHRHWQVVVDVWDPDATFLEPDAGVGHRGISPRRASSGPTSEPASSRTSSGSSSGR